MYSVVVQCADVRLVKRTNKSHPSARAPPHGRTRPYCACQQPSLMGAARRRGSGGAGDVASGGAACRRERWRAPRRASAAMGRRRGDSSGDGDVAAAASRGRWRVGAAATSIGSRADHRRTPTHSAPVWYSTAWPLSCSGAARDMGDAPRREWERRRDDARDGQRESAVGDQARARQEWRRQRGQRGGGTEERGGKRKMIARRR